MSPQEQIEVVQAFLVQVNKMDWEAASKFMHEDFYVDEPNGMPYAGHWSGREGFVELMTSLRSTWSSWRDQPYPYQLASVANLVFKEVKFTATLADGGRAVEMHFVEVFEFDGDRMRTVRPYYFDPTLLSDTATT